MKKIIYILLLTIVLVNSAFAEFLDSNKLKGSRVDYKTIPKKNIPLPPFFAIESLHNKEVKIRVKKEINEIKEKIIYPLVRENPSPITAIILEFPRNNQNDLVIHYYYENGISVSAIIHKDIDGTYGERAYKILIDEQHEE